QLARIAGIHCEPRAGTRGPWRHLGALRRFLAWHPAYRQAHVAPVRHRSRARAPHPRRMSNVLPESESKATWRMYRARFLVAGSLLLISCAARAALVLLPSYLILGFDAIPSAQQTSPDTATQSDRLEIAHTQALMTQLSPLVATTSPSALVEQAL